MASRYEDAQRNAHSESVPTFLDTMVFDVERSRGAWLHESSQRRDYLDLTSSFGRDDLGYNHRRFKAAEPTGFTGSSGVVLHAQENLDRLRQRLIESCCGPYGVALGASLDDVYQWVLKTVLAAKPSGARMLELSWDEGLQLDTARLSGYREPHAATLALEELLAEDDGPVAGLWVELPSVAEAAQESLSHWLAGLGQICKRHDALLVLDEVKSGFGRSGLWWDWQHFDVEPDLVVFGGGSKVSGVFIHNRLTALPSYELACPEPSQVAWCDLLLDVIEDEGLLGHAEVMGLYLRKVLSGLKVSFEQIRTVRSRGLRASFELPSKNDRDRVLEACFGENLILLPIGECSIGFYPPLDVRADAIGRAAAQLEVALQAVYEAES